MFNRSRFRREKFLCYLLKSNLATTNQTSRHENRWTITLSNRTVFTIYLYHYTTTTNTLGATTQMITSIMRSRRVKNWISRLSVLGIAVRLFRLLDRLACAFRPEERDEKVSGLVDLLIRAALLTVNLMLLTIAPSVATNNPRAHSTGMQTTLQTFC